MVEPRYQMPQRNTTIHGMPTRRSVPSHSQANVTPRRNIYAAPRQLQRSRSQVGPSTLQTDADRELRRIYRDRLERFERSKGNRY